MRCDVGRVVRPQCRVLLSSVLSCRVVRGDPVDLVAVAGVAARLGDSTLSLSISHVLGFVLSIPPTLVRGRSVVD